MSAFEKAKLRWAKHYERGFVHVVAERRDDKLVITIEMPAGNDKTLVMDIAGSVEKVIRKEAIVCFGEVPRRMGLRKVR